MALLHITHRDYWQSIRDSGLLTPGIKARPVAFGPDKDKVSAFTGVDLEDLVFLRTLRSAIVRTKNVIRENLPFAEEDFVFLVIDEDCPGIDWEMNNQQRIELRQLGVPERYIERIGYAKTAGSVPLAYVHELTLDGDV